MSRLTHVARRLTSPTIALCSVLAGGCTDSAPVAPPVVRPSAAITAAGPSVFAIGNIIGYGVNDAGAIVGPSDGTKSSAYLWDASTGLRLLGTGGIAWDVSQDGRAVGGRNAANKAVLWIADSVSGSR